MIFSGDILTFKRNFYSQTNNFGFILSLNVDNTTGQYSFGISGEQNSLEFLLNSGKIYFENKFIHTYESNNTFVIGCQFTPNAINVTKNQTPLAFGLPKQTGAFDYFFITRENNKIAGEFDLFVSGDNIPNYYVQNQGILFNTGQEAVTGYFINQSSYPINIFDSSILTTTLGYDFGKLKQNISGNGSAFFAYTGDFSALDLSNEILTTFNTSFADITVAFSILDARAFNRFVFLNSPNIFSFNTENEMNLTVAWNNFSGQNTSDNFNTNLYFGLEYIDGSGTSIDPNYATNVNYSALTYGDFQVSGLLTGLFSIATGDSVLTGNYVIPLSQFAWATGSATGFFSGSLSTGLASGLGYTGRAIGGFTGLVTGYVYNGSGTLSINSILTGYPLEFAYSLDYPSYTNATGFLNISGMSYGDSFYIGSYNDPIVKGVQFINETGLVYYLSGASQHKVNAVYSDNIILLESLFSGTLGNGTFVQEYQCAVGQGFYDYSPVLTGGQNLGSTGELVVPIGTFTGNAQTTIAGSGNYAVLLTGTGNGDFVYTKTFTGSWDIYTGVDALNLVSLKQPGQFTDVIIFGTGILPPNSQMALKIVNNTDNISTDTARIIISGNDVINPISQLISN